MVKIVDNVPLDRCALIGCGVMTGSGALCNTAKVEAGSICVAFGAGGVGLNAIQGCVTRAPRWSSRLSAPGVAVPGRAPEARRVITRRYRIDEAPQAFDDLAQGRNARGVIVFG